MGENTNDCAGRDDSIDDDRKVESLGMRIPKIPTMAIGEISFEIVNDLEHIIITALQRITNAAKTSATIIHYANLDRLPMSRILGTA